MLKEVMIGRVGKDAEVKQVNGQHVINFSLCHSKKTKDKDGNDVEIAHWRSCAYWRKSTESTKIADWLKKGSIIYVEGLTVPSVYNRQNGGVGVDMKMNVYKIELCGGKRENNNDAPMNVNHETGEVYSDDLPY